MSKQFKPSPLSAKKETISGMKFFFQNNNPLFSLEQTAKPSAIVPGTTIVARPFISSSQRPHPYQIPLPKPSTTSTSSSQPPSTLTLMSLLNSSPSRSNNLRITKTDLPTSTKVLNSIQKQEAMITRRLIGKKVSDAVNVIQKKVQESKEAGVSFKPYIDPNFNPVRDRKEHFNQYDPERNVFYFKQMVEQGMFPKVQKDVLITAADWLILGRNGWGNFMYVWLMANSQEVLSAIAILVGPDALDEKQLLTSVSDLLSNANPVPLGIMAVLPTITEPFQLCGDGPEGSDSKTCHPESKG